ncbi:DUF3099 domain-containing protein [Streptomyces pactum]|uniref:DUF3099 domain-containing protein n=1 Tax=Streptomyces pactum TaxID=68249 RepID=A0ABS0NGA7_9ACTN|nr:DUF3099 domain-containing protein [Streptomyces pactum]MBH5334211.1 DUF3099 domain-containing protein [Streptomyces pactum]
MRKHDGAQVFRITGARQSLAEDVRGRQRRYIISMTVRTVSVVLAAVLWNVERHVAFVALVLGILLPYIAVVIANAGRENTPSLPSSFIPTPTRPMLEAQARHGDRGGDRPGGGTVGDRGAEPVADDVRRPSEDGPDARR